MAEQFMLVRTYDFASDIDSVSLINNTDGFDVSYQGWTPVNIPNRDNVVRQAVTLRVQGTSTDDIAVSLQKLADKREQARRFYADGIEDYAVWFRVQMSGETKGRQTLVREIEHEPASAAFDYALRQRYHWNQYTIGISHDPWFEGTAAGTITAATVSMNGGTFSFGTVYGDLSARMARIVMQPIMSTATGGTHNVWPWGQMWVGFRSNRYGTPSNWVPWYRPVFYLAGATAEPYAYQGTALNFPYTTGGTPGGYPLCFINMDLMTDYAPEKMFGSFLVLARMKTCYNGTADWYAGTAYGGTASKMEFRVRMVSLMSNDYYAGDIAEAKYYPRVTVARAPWEIPGTSVYEGTYDYYEMGVVNFPPTGKTIDGANWGDFEMWFFADPPDMTDYSGTAFLWINGCVFIPTEGYYWAGRSLDRSRPWLLFSNATDGTVIYTGYNGPDGRMTARAHRNQGPTSPVFAVGMPQPFYSGGVPVGSGIGVIAASSVKQFTPIGGSSLAGSVTINYFERWQSLRGNDGA